MTATPIAGMVDHLDSSGSGPTEAEIAFVKAYLAEGPMDPALLANLPQGMAEREARMAELRARDWPNLGQYRDANAALTTPPTAVFIGDSLTEFWQGADPDFYSNGIVGRGISGQTSPQMLLRFYQDVVALHPHAVHIMAGTNDLAANTGPTSPDDFKNNIRAMVDLARANHIRVILASILPADRFPWRPDIHPVEQIRQLNAWLRQFADQHKLIYADYYSSLTTPSGAFRPELSNDGVHPNSDGYAAMRPIADAALRKAMLGSP